MKGHPGGQEHTLRMLEQSGLKPPASILDMGAGAGESVKLLRERGFDCRGIDIAPEDPLVEQDDILNTAFSDECFDGIISQCVFYVSGERLGAAAECRRLLKRGGILMLSDVFFEPTNEAIGLQGFTLIHSEDITQLWREYYIEAIWRGTADCVPVKGRCRYLSLIYRKD